MTSAFETGLEIVERLRKVDCQSYFVGGCVRDMLLKIPLGDIDIATDASPTIITTIFPKTLAIGAAFGVIVVQHGNFSFEISTFRSDGSYSDGRHPDQVNFSSMKEDALRRDFTINGLFYDPKTEKIYDYVNGREDLANKLIRTIGLPRQRFSEDKLRLMRAVRFAAKLDFRLDERTRSAIIKESASLVVSVSVERIWQELKKMADHPTFTASLYLLYDLKLLTTIFPELKSQTALHIKQAIGNLKNLSPKEFPVILLLQPLFTSLNFPDIERSFRRLKISNREWTIFKKWHSLLPHLSSHKAERVFWTYFFADSDSDLLIKFAIGRLPTQEQRINLINKIKSLKESLENHILRLATNSPLVSAGDLMEKGIPQGRLLGDLLKEAECLTIENNYLNKEDVLTALRTHGFWK